MAAKSRSKRTETIRNIFLIVVAVGMVAFFFTLDFGGEGDSVFNRKGQTRLYFRGDLGRNDYSKDEYDKMVRYVNSYAKTMESTTIETRLQDSYKKVTDNSPVIFEVHIVMKDGSQLSTSARRSPRGSLVSAMLSKANKDIRVYHKLKKEGKDVKSLINAN